MDEQTALFICRVLGDGYGNLSTHEREAQSVIAQAWQRFTRDSQMSAAQCIEMARRDWLVAYLADWRPPVTVHDTTHFGEG